MQLWLSMLLMPLLSSPPVLLLSSPPASLLSSPPSAVFEKSFVKICPSLADGGTFASVFEVNDHLEVRKWTSWWSTTSGWQSRARSGDSWSSDNLFGTSLVQLIRSHQVLSLSNDRAFNDRVRSSCHDESATPVLDGVEKSKCQLKIGFWLSLVGTKMDPKTRTFIRSIDS